MCMVLAPAYECFSAFSFVDMLTANSPPILVCLLVFFIISNKSNSDIGCYK